MTEPEPKRVKVEEDDDFEDHSNKNGSRATTCPYLDTVDRSMLDFDFEKVCSVSLSNLNVYACLVCGKYFQGRGVATHAYNHSIHVDHHVFINLQSKKVYCLPDNYEVIDANLDDIKYLLDPTFSKSDIETLDTRVTTFRGLDGHDYVPGAIGINNLKQTSYISATLNALVHVPPLRNFFLTPANYAKVRSPLVKCFGEFVRKIWNPANFKGHVSPHELMQAVTLLSNRRFQIGTVGDVLDFTSWFLNALHTELGGTKKKSTIITETFQGTLQITTEKLEKISEDQHSTAQIKVIGATVTKIPFLFLTMDPPSMPIFKDVQERNIIPQIPMYTALAKFDGKTVTVSAHNLLC
eukprot:c6506_g1_i3.p1 GENE.c6506_g1_i3~~c6506_g1_i3.p1  ORF type:complete len:367 (-),score=74.15 c6506_g1_i3:530-1585(-)